MKTDPFGQLLGMVGVFLNTGCTGYFFGLSCSGSKSMVLELRPDFLLVDLQDFCFQI